MNHTTKFRNSQLKRREETEWQGHKWVKTVERVCRQNLFHAPAESVLLSASSKSFRILMVSTKRSGDHKISLNSRYQKWVELSHFSQVDNFWVSGNDFGQVAAIQRFQYFQNVREFCMGRPCWMCHPTWPPHITRLYIPGKLGPTYDYHFFDSTPISSSYLF